MQGHPTVKHFNGEWVWDTRFMFPALVVSRIFDSGMVKKCMRKNHLRRKTQGFKYHGFYKSGFHPTLPLAKIDQFTDPLDSGIPKCCWKRYWKEKTDIAPENWRLGYFYSWAGPIFGGGRAVRFWGRLFQFAGTSAPVIWSPLRSALLVHKVPVNRALVATCYWKGLRDLRMEKIGSQPFICLGGRRGESVNEFHVLKKFWYIQKFHVMGGLVENQKPCLRRTKNQT